MTPSTVTVEDHGRVRLVTLNRPDALNAFNNELFDELTDAFLAAASHDGVHAVVLTGAGRAFSAGADLTEMGRPAQRPRHGMLGLLDTIIDFPKPFLIAVNGLGVGIGATITGVADLVYIAEGARLRCPFSALGLTAEAASTATFPLLMGRQRAMWFLLSSEWLDAQQCVDAGLAMEVCPEGTVVDRALEHAATLAELPLTSLVTTKGLIVGPQREHLRSVVRAENAELARLAGGPANREAIAAFRDKRKPDFSALS
jgi:enoyl-CoA hydratase/carnithine racemase